MTRRRVLAALIALFAFCVAVWALARPGGGHSYSGSSSSSSSGSGSSGGGDGEAVAMVLELLIWLCIEHPVIGIPLLIGVSIGYLFLRSSNSAGKAWDSSSMSATSELRQRMAAAARDLDAQRKVDKGQGKALSALERIRELDPQFSVVLFEDFLYSLYPEVHAARGSGTLSVLSPYVAETAARDLRRGNATRVEAVVIGALRYRDVIGLDDESAERIRVTVEFQANYTEAENDQLQTYYVVESWELSRNKKARSRPPKRARVIDCPNCGAPLDKVVNATCTFCHAAVGSGDFDWIVEKISVETREPRPPALTGDVEERGTERRTLVHSEASERLLGLQERDPAVTLPALEARARLIFAELQRGWNARDLLLCRAYLSDRLFETLGYWLDAYARAGLCNVTENADVTSSELSRVVSDVHYDSITLRVFASGLDYTLDSNEKLVSGSRKKERPYSEYWTLIRGSSVKGAPRTDANCPSCGAPLDINRAGSCNHCKAEVTSGDFDWVLSKIEQDDDY